MMVPRAGELSHEGLTEDSIVIGKRQSANTSGKSSTVKTAKSFHSIDDATESFKFLTDADFGKRMAQARNAKGMTQQQLATACRLKVDMITKIEKGVLPKQELNPLKQKLMKMAGMTALKSKHVPKASAQQLKK